jgi:Fe-S cluster biosynthesis and repair protein YggX
VPLLSIHQCNCFEIVSQHVSFVLFPTQKANAIAIKYKLDAKETHQGQQKLINENNLLINAMKIQHREKLTQQKKSHSEAVQLNNARICKFIDKLSGMQQMFNELLDEIMDACQMV